jgi:hypothetical protein
MDWQRLAIMTLMEVFKELTSRLGHHDLSEKCTDCMKEVEANTESPQKEG